MFDALYCEASALPHQKPLHLLCIFQRYAYVDTAIFQIFYFLLHLKVCNIRTAQNIKAAHLSLGPCVIKPDIAGGGKNSWFPS